MGAVIVAIGDEVLYGMTPNTNAARIALALAQRGFFAVQHIVVSDRPEEIQNVLLRELEKGRDVITTGGLGPTIDDTTRTAVAKLFLQPLVRREEWFQTLLQRYGRGFPTLNDQSMQPQKAFLLNNTVGTAPGLYMEDAKAFPGSRLFVLPGPPQEMQDVLFKEVLPRYFEGSPQRGRLLRFVGVREHEVDPLLRDLQQRYPNLIVGIYPSYELISVRLAVRDGPDVLDAAVKEVSSAFSSSLLGESESLEEAVCAALRRRGWKMAAAESCTGGGLGAALTSVPGASDVFLGAVTAYCDQVKKAVLSVPQAILDEYGAVSIEATQAMASGVQKLLGSDVSCATSGCFGPTGGTQKAPVGTVCCSLLFPEGEASYRFSFHGSRASICERTIQAVLKELFLYFRDED